MIQYFVIRNFRGTSTSVKILKVYVVICRNAEGVHSQRNVGNPCARRYNCYIFQKNCC